MVKKGNYQAQCLVMNLKPLTFHAKKKENKMRKMIIAAIIGCTAMFANAAAVNWYVGYITDASGANLLGAGDTDYVAMLSIYSDSGLGTLVGSTSVNNWEDGLALDESGTFELANTSDITYYGQVIITHGGDTLKSDGFQVFISSMSDAIDLAIMTSSDEASGVEKIGGGAFDGANGVFETAGGGGGWAPIPEPTTGLLVLIGVAGLALRRRRA